MFVYVLNHSQLKDVITVAAGENALERYLTKVSTYWREKRFDLVPYKRKCKLVKGWEPLFEQLDEHLGGLAGMRQSPFYACVAVDANSWEQRLTALRLLLDVWIDVQRR